MTKLDPSKQQREQRLTKEGAQILVKSTGVTREEASREKREEERSFADPTMAINDNAISLTELAKRNEGRREDEPMEIAETTNRNRNADSSIHGAIVNRATFSSQPRTIEEEISRMVNSLSPNPSASRLSQPCLTKAKSLVEQLISDESSPVTVDPRFYVCTSFEEATISQKISLAIGESQSQKEIMLPRGSLRSNVALSSIALSPSLTSVKSSIAPFPSLTSVKSSQYHDYCLSEGEFDVALPSSQSTSSDVTRMKRSEEISRRIEDRDFHVQESLIPDDDDIVMSPM